MASAPQATPKQAAEPAPEALSDAPVAITSVVMPVLGESVTEGTVTPWLKTVGDVVGIDEPLLEVSTEQNRHPNPVPGHRHAAVDHRRRA